MRRLCALALLVTFVSVPALQVECAVSCARAETPDIAGDCPHAHQTPANGPGLAADPRCCHDALLAVGVETSATRELVRAGIVSARLTVGTGVTVDLAQREFAVPWLSGPPGPFLVPLRI